MLLLYFGGICQNEYLRFDNINIKDGLSHSYVKSIFQDSQGFLWFSTRNGLNRYAGYTFKVYKNNSEDLSSFSSTPYNGLPLHFNLGVLFF